MELKLSLLLLKYARTLFSFRQSLICLIVINSALEQNINSEGWSIQNCITCYFEPSKTATNVHYVWRCRSYLTGNIVKLLLERSLNAVRRNNHCLLQQPYGAHTEGQNTELVVLNLKVRTLRTKSERLIIHFGVENSIIFLLWHK